MSLLSSRLSAHLSAGYAQGLFSGCVALVGQPSGELLYHHAVGRYTPYQEELTETALFDLASLTKACSTSVLCMLAGSENKISLSTPVQHFFPSWRDDPDKASLELWHLLHHCSGLVWWLPFFEKYSLETLTEEPRTARRDIISCAASAPLDYLPCSKTVYSDLNFLLLGDILETVYGKTLDLLFAEKIAAPLSLSLRYLPRWLSEKPKAVPTELCPWRKTRLQAEVHDDNAWAMGGVAGHAGLFGTANDLFRLSCALLQGTLVPAETRDSFWNFQPPVGTFRGGWDSPSSSLSSAGRYFSSESIGHLGFTGTSLWIDRRHDLIAILLSNRVYGGRGSDAIKPFRRQYYDIIGESLGLPMLREH
jgi:CubicO group peptidase (beta-lactamase class C family)